MAARHLAYKHKMSKKWSRIMHPNKTWHSLTEDTMQRAAAAWIWLHHYFRELGGSLPLNCRINRAALTKWIPPCVVLIQRVALGDGNEAARAIASFGNAKWAALGLELRMLQIGDTMHYGFQDVPLEWIHVVKVQDWWVQPCKETRVEGHGIGT